METNNFSIVVDKLFYLEICKDLIKDIIELCILLETCFLAFIPKAKLIS